MHTSHHEHITLRNAQLTLSFKRRGGTLFAMRHISSVVNPLDFSLQRVEGADQYFEGHFICAPRWGDVMAGEEQQGLLKHGDFCHLPWIIKQENELTAEMQSYSASEQLSVTRTVQLHPNTPVFRVNETIQNHAPVYRPCNLVQHPTLAGDFLHAHTRIDCNAATGWRDNGTGQLPGEVGDWPNVYNSKQQKADLRLPTPSDGGVYSFNIADEATGWVTALDPVTHLLLGYCWSAKNYLFIHHWVHVEEEHVKYRGIEFGTAALHQPFSIQQELSFRWNDLPSCFFLDAGASATFQYEGFLCAVDKDAVGVQSLSKKEDTMELQLDGCNEPLILSTL